MLTALTGATGFLGSYLLRELLASDGDVVALVRDTPAIAARRLRHALETTGTGLPEDFDQRVQVVQRAHPSRWCEGHPPPCRRRPHCVL
ncbi:NAD-dependent epimerase/dehydratase family protein [Streptomyces dangxiongensis]|uniref:NAD-dependent epimerase/dehydratase family protein n=1 Tax=Streptomyces dangxiongensis TaxID=1442032 RepID=A0A3G2JLI1_9ACTN|nr:NAD-dependent epimerase/dehydratase family protein [Streptomyces dangxiongensis]